MNRLARWLGVLRDWGCPCGQVNGDQYLTCGACRSPRC